jgi:membrane protease YdiL (CAAX protease family)
MPSEFQEPEPSEEEPPPDQGAAGLVRLGLYFYGAMMAIALVWRMGFYGESILFASAQDELEGLHLGRDALIGLVVGLAVVLASRVMTRATGWGEAMARALGESLGRISVPDALLLAVASGLGEELFFRGALQPRVGLILATVLFGAVHFVPRRELLPWTGFAMAAGLVLGVLFDWTGSVVAPVVAHTVVNGINLPLLTREYGDPKRLPSADT